MGVRRPQAELLERLSSKTLDERFTQIIRDGLNCSPFEAEAVLDAVREVYGPYLGTSAEQPLPGQLALVAVDAEEPAGKPISECAKRTVVVTVHRGAQDDRAMLEKGMDGWRRERVAQVCQEALSQGALLTREDLAYRVFFVSARTISRDLAWLRRERPKQPLPIRSLMKDIGPVLTHRELIVQQALAGKTMTEISRETYHSPSAIANYLSTFTRCVQLSQKGVHPAQIAFLLQRGPGLIGKYIALAEAAGQDPNQRQHLFELLKLGQSEQKKSPPVRRLP